MVHHLHVLAAALAASIWLAPDSAAQSADTDEGADSVRLHAAARKAQAAFERVRQYRLPWIFESGSSRCDEIVGRYCVRHDRGDDRWVAPREHRAISEARDALLAQLRETLRALPGDDWVIGQRVAYLLDAERPDDALDAAMGCAASAWWCAALAGLVHHERGETVRAAAAFERAIGRMPPDELTRWTDLRAVLGERDARRLQRSDSAARDSLARVLWWLADPLWMRAGNDRLTEQYARQVRARIARAARTPEGARWGWDLEELLLRMGRPTGWERRSSGAIDGRVSVVTHRAPFGREFIPPLEYVREPSQMPEGAWDLVPRIPVTEYAPAYARFEGEVRHQLVVIPDGDSAVIAAAFAFRHDSVAADDSALMALVLASSGFAAIDSGRQVAGGAVRTIRLARRDAVASVEILVDAPVPRAARARFGVPLVLRDSTAIALSDPLLLDPGPPPVSRDEAIARLLLPGSPEGADSVGVYFEAGRLAPDVPVDVEVMLEPERGGTLRRIGESVGLFSPRTAVRLAWTEPPPASGRLRRGVTLSFRDVPAGAYVLHLVVRQGAAWGASRAAIAR